jgi:hypothetical protein
VAQIVADGELVFAHLGQHASNRVPKGMPAHSVDAELGECGLDLAVEYSREIRRLPSISQRLLSDGFFEQSSHAGSHSLVMSVVWATAFAALFWRLGRRAFAVAWLAVFSHYVLDLTVQGASLYPNEPRRLLIPTLVANHYRLFQLLVCIVLLAVFLYDERRSFLAAWRVWAVCGLVLALNLRFLLGV